MTGYKQTHQNVLKLLRKGRQLTSKSIHATDHGGHSFVSKNGSKRPIATLLLFYRTIKMPYFLWEYHNIFDGSDTLTSPTVVS